MRKKTLLLLIAGFVVLALFAPVAMATTATKDYPDHSQFRAYYEPDKISIEESPDAGTTHYNPAAASLTATRATRSLSGEDWPQFMQNAANTGYSVCDDVPSFDPTVYHTDGIDIPGSINPVVVKNASGKIKILVITGYPGFQEPNGLTEVNLTCIDRDTLDIDWQYAIPREPDQNNYYTNSWSSAATDGTYAYASSDNKTVCVNMLTGQEVWTFTMQYKNCDGSPTLTDDYVFCSDWGDGSGGNYYCLYKSNGNVKWIFNNTCTREDMQYAQGTPAYDPSEGTEGMVYLTGWGYNSVTDHSGQLYKVDVATGDEEENFGIGDSESFCGSVSVDDDYIYVASYSFASNGKLYSLYKSNFTVVNSVSVEGTDATPAIDPRGRVYTSGGLALASCYVAPAVRCYSTPGLSLNWNNNYSGVGGWTSSVAIARYDDDGGYPVFAGKEDPLLPMAGCYNTTYSLTAYPQNMLGTPYWNYPKGGGTAAIAWDEVYNIDYEGDLYIFT